MAKKATKKKAAPKKVAKKPAKKAAKKKASSKHQIIITFIEEKDGTGVKFEGLNVSPKMMMMAHEVLAEAIVKEMTGSPSKG